jgi:hypothetical protein
MSQNDPKTKIEAAPDTVGGLRVTKLGSVKWKGQVYAPGSTLPKVDTVTAKELTEAGYVETRD